MILNPYERAGTAYTKMMKPFLTPRMIARNLFAHTIRLPKGKVKLDFNKVSQMKDATIQLTLPDDTLKRDLIGLSSDSIRCPFVVNGFEITQDQLQAFASEGTDLPNEGIKAMSQTLSAKDQTLLLDSYKPNGTDAMFKGLYASATTIDNTAYDFGTAGKASEGTAAIVGLLQEAIVEDCNFNMLISYAQLTTLKNSWIVGSGTGIWEIEKVIKNLNPVEGAAPGRIYASKYAPSATKAIISPNDPAGMYMDLVIGQDPRVITGFDSKLGPDDSPVYVTGFEAVVPLIYYPEAIGILGSI